MREITVKVHEVAVDGLPDPENGILGGRAAFITNGCVISGGYVGNGVWWPDGEIESPTEFREVTHWLEFPVPIVDLEVPKLYTHFARLDLPEAGVADAPGPPAEGAPE